MSRLKDSDIEITADGSMETTLKGEVFKGYSLRFESKPGDTTLPEALGEILSLQGYNHGKEVKITIRVPLYKK